MEPMSTARMFPVLACALLVIGGATAAAQEARTVRTDEHAVRVVTLVEGLEHPWAIAFLPDGRLLVTERPGRLRVVRDGTLDPRPVAGLPPIAAVGQGGLLDIALHPRFEDNTWVYLAYAAAGPGGTGTEVLRGRLRGHAIEDVEVLFREVRTGPDGLLYLLTDSPRGVLARLEPVAR
jgi:aldose sugar dehydrogenase